MNNSNSHYADRAMAPAAADPTRGRFGDTYTLEWPRNGELELSTPTQPFNALDRAAVLDEACAQGWGC